MESVVENIGQSWVRDLVFPRGELQLLVFVATKGQHQDCLGLSCPVGTMLYMKTSVV